MSQDNTKQPLPQQEPQSKEPKSANTQRDKPEQPPVITDYASI